ncbi:MAG: hypothetical protein ABGW50_01575 [Thermococcus sp.]
MTGRMGLRSSAIRTEMNNLRAEKMKMEGTVKSGKKEIGRMNERKEKKRKEEKRGERRQGRAQEKKGPSVGQNYHVLVIGLEPQRDGRSSLG